MDFIDFSSFNAFNIFLLSIVIVLYILAVIVILFEKKNPTKAVAWLLVLVFLPVIGFIFYILFGRSWRKKRWVEDKSLIDYSLVENMIEGYINRFFKDEKTFEKLGSKARLVRLLTKSAEAPLTCNNRMQVIKDGEEKYKIFFDMLEKAVNHIHLEYYIIRDDFVGEKLVKTLEKKAEEGVEVRLLYDAVGSSCFDKKYYKRLMSAGVKVSVFLPVMLPLLNSRLNYRNHRKIAIVDGGYSLIGGINIGKEYLGLNRKFGYWRDTHLLVEGDGVYGLQLIFLLDWIFSSNEKVNMKDYFPPQRIFEEKHYVQIASSGPDSKWESILQMYFTIIMTAEKSVYITSPYFIPDDSILMALKTAALSGVDVRLIIPSKPDYKIVYWASHSYLEDIMEAGVRVYLYEKGFMHAKSIIADKVVASVGTTNMDLRSFNYNFEVNAFIYDKEIVEELESQFWEDLNFSQELYFEEYRCKKFPRRLKESFARLFSPLL